MTWSERLHYAAAPIAIIFGGLFLVDSILFTVISHCIGGPHFYGEVQGDRYFVAFCMNHERCPLTEVSKFVYYFNVYHDWSLKVLACIAGPAVIMAVVTRSFLPDRRPKFVIRITQQEILVNGVRTSAKDAVEALRQAELLTGDLRPHILIDCDYVRENAPPHAIAFEYERWGPFVPQ